MHTKEHVGLFGDSRKKPNVDHLSLVLASSSPYRKALLERLRVPFSTVSPDIDESPLEDETHVQLVQRLAERKAKALANDFPQHLIIGSDQVAVCTGQIFGKPHDTETAVAQLNHFSGRAVTFYTGLSVLNSESGVVYTVTEPYSVYFRTLTETKIRHYIELEQPLNCAGSFKCEGLGITLFHKMKGDDPNSLIGLPLIRLTDLLSRHGFELPEQAR
ncbi:septum formation inhibitor Maf [Aliidiomarina shirensis]|uniref:7-methyl-GTP pyrophosphatase n=1 Tax=Aliidiomarina shirensis TaxID=1048642 RepID=A0A432WX89_9GAMM|nr:nucleoside triphosphate pyrophosphatase [Aliidiomarina shirensis]RUO38400.1 septum formation inhibitor Maf [Aliidiomarina shirensis]